MLLTICAMGKWKRMKQSGRNWEVQLERLSFYEGGQSFIVITFEQTLEKGKAVHHEYI